MLYNAETGGGIVKWFSPDGNVVERLVLIHIVLRDIEAGCVGQVIGFESVAKHVMFMDR